MSPKLYVNNIIEELYDATIGIEMNPERIKRNLCTIMDVDEKGIDLLYSAIPLMPGEGFFSITNFRQFVVRIQLNKDPNKSAIIFYDFKNNIDIAIECYQSNSENGWDAFSKDAIMKEFQEVEKNYQSLEFAELTMEDL